MVVHVLLLPFFLFRLWTPNVETPAEFAADRAALERATWVYEYNKLLKKVSPSISPAVKRNIAPI